MISIKIVCDGCLEVGFTITEAARKQGIRYAHQARGQLQELDGWKVGLPGGRDLCPHCALEERSKQS